MADDETHLDARYWLSFTANEFRWYVPRRRWVALARSLTLITRGDNGERCQVCGRSYRRTLWHAPDGLYQAVVGQPGGLYCPACFTDKAKAAGYQQITWVPHIEHYADVWEAIPHG